MINRLSSLASSFTFAMLILSCGSNNATVSDASLANNYPPGVTNPRPLQASCQYSGNVALNPLNPTPTLTLTGDMSTAFSNATLSIDGQKFVAYKFRCYRGYETKCSFIERLGGCRPKQSYSCRNMKSKVTDVLKIKSFSIARWTDDPYFGMAFQDNQGPIVSIVGPSGVPDLIQGEAPNINFSNWRKLTSENNPFQCWGLDQI